MSATNFSTANQTFRQLIGNGFIYHVPRFQRDYSWGEDEWDDLWRDMENILDPNGEPAHYMGYLVLQTKDNKTFDVIDGQQRLATLSVFCLAVLDSLRKLINNGVDTNDNEQREKELRSTYIGYLDPVTLIPKSKVNLNRNNDVFYQTYLVPLQNIPNRGLKATDKLLRNAFLWFQKKISERFIRGMNGASLAEMIGLLADKLFFTVITVTDELNAFKVFETLNARGVRLSSTDLLKNYIFSVVHSTGNNEVEMNILEGKWGVIVEKLEAEKFPDFLRFHWNSRHSFVRHSDLFKTMRETICKKADVFQLLRDMDEDTDIYIPLSDPNDSYWTNHPGKRYVQELRMFGVRQPFPLLMAACRTLSQTDFSNVLRACSICSFRYNVIGGLGTGEQERIYNSVAEKIHKKEVTTASTIIALLRPIYPTDEQFRAAFSEKQLDVDKARNNRVVRYILFELEHRLSQKDFNTESDDNTVEHILPQNSKPENWPAFSNDEQAEAAVNRLGNLTLLSCKENRDLGDKPYCEKKMSYARSQFSLTQKIAEHYKDWTPDKIAERQKEMAKEAVALWRIAQF